MRLIHKYRVSPLTHTISMRRNARILSAGIDLHGDLCVWAEVDEKPEFEDRTIIVVPTGGFAPPDSAQFVQTVIAGPFVWHIYQLPPA